LGRFVAATLEWWGQTDGEKARGRQRDKREERDIKLKRRVL
jgi:hypothetical protein